MITMPAHGPKRRKLLVVSAAVLLLGAATALVLRYWPSFEAKQPPPIPESHYIPPAPRDLEVPPLPFTDVTNSSGIVFSHNTGAFTNDAGGESRFLPECMGPGIVAFDADGDGDCDLFVPNGCAFEGRPETSPAPTCRLFRNDGGFHFTDITSEAGLALRMYGMGGAAADVDGDGRADLLITTWGGVRLFKNVTMGATCRFEEITKEAGLESPGWVDADGHTGPDWSTSAAFFDADANGTVDLFVCNYVKWSPAIDVFTSLDGRHKSFAIPERYHGNSCRLFLNDGSGHFKDVTREAGVFSEEGKSLGVAIADVNDDGLWDIVVANDTQPNFLYVNQGGGHFKESGLEAGIAYDENARTRAGMGIDASDPWNDGVLAIPIGNFSNEPVAVYRREARGFFRDVTQQCGVAAVTQVFLTFGVVFADLDLDGWQDLVLANGHIEPRIQSTQAEVSYAQRPQILWNDRSGRFLDAVAATGAAFNTPLVARGLAVADFDQDGDLDLAVSTNGGPPRLFRNDCANKHHWLRVHLVGRAPNTEALGAVVTIKTATSSLRRVVHSGSSYLSQSELTLSFGLGSESAVLSLSIHWPDGVTEVHPTPGIDQTLTFRH